MPVRLGSSDHGRRLAERGLDVVAHVPGHAGQLAGRAEVADQRQVRVGGVAARSSSSCPAAISTSEMRISAVVSRTPVVLIPMYRRPGCSLR